MKSILLVGMGRFGRHMAAKFCELRQDVLAVDLDEARINDALSFVTSAQIGDSTNEQFVSGLGVRNFDLCMVAIGDNFQSSLETTALLKDCGAKYVVARASRDVHAKFLLRNGADEVVYAEKEMAIRTAVKFSYDHIFDYIELTPEYSIYELPVPHAWVGKTVVQLAVRSRYHISVLATKLGDRLSPLPGADHVFRAEERIVVMGNNKDVKKIM